MNSNLKQKLVLVLLGEQAQLNLLRSDIKIIAMRGNIDTRISKLKKKEFDAIVLSLAGIQMLEFRKGSQRSFYYWTNAASYRARCNCFAVQTKMIKKP